MHQARDLGWHPLATQLQWRSQSLAHIFPSNALRYLLDGMFVAEELETLPTLRFFPDPASRMMPRIQLSWMARLVEDIQKLWDAMLARPFFTSWFGR